MECVGRLLCDSSVEIGGSTLVAGNWDSHWLGDDDQIYNGVLCGRFGWRRVVDRCATLFAESVVMGWSGFVVVDFPAQPYLANPTQVHFTGIPFEHPRTRR